MRFPNKWYQSRPDVRITVEEASHLSSIGKTGKKKTNPTSVGQSN